MGHDQHQTRSVETWLAAEHGSDDAEADTALQDLIQVLPVPVPPAGFAGRVLAAAARDGLVRVPPGRRRFGPTARLLAWCGGGAVALVGTLVVLGPFLVRQVVGLLNFSVQGFVWIVRGLEGGLDAWSLIAEIGRVVGASLTTPQVSLSVVLLELVGVVAQRQRMDDLISESADHWRIERMAVVDRNVLRVAAYEMTSFPHTPPAVVIDEAIEVARKYGSEESGSFINGILDSVRRRIEQGRAAPDRGDPA